MTARDPLAAQEQKSISAPARKNQGFALREDLIKRLKRVALEEDRRLYEVMEEAIGEYLARHEEASRGRVGR